MSYHIGDRVMVRATEVVPFDRLSGKEGVVTGRETWHGVEIVSVVFFGESVTWEFVPRELMPATQTRETRP